MGIGEEMWANESVFPLTPWIMIILAPGPRRTWLYINGSPQMGVGQGTFCPIEGTVR